MNSRALALAIALSTVAMLACRLALAQADTSEALVRHGIELVQAGHDEESIDVFRRAWEAGHRPIALAQWGLAEQAVGRWVSAEAHVREARTTYATDAWVVRNRAALDSAYAVIALHVGTLEVRGEPAGAEVFVDGERLGALPMSEPLHALVGTVRLEVRAEGRETVSRRVEILAGQLAREEVTLAMAAPLAQQGDVGSHATVHVDSAPSRVPGVVVGAVGVLAVILGAVVVASSMWRGGAPAGCVDGPSPWICSSPTAAGDVERAANSVYTGDGIMVGGGIIALVGIVWATVSGGRSSREGPSARLWRIVPGISGVSVQGRF